MQMFIKLRGAIFAEDGFNLKVFEIAPDGIKKTSCVYLSKLDARGKTVRMEEMPGTEGAGAAGPVLNIPLRPYHDTKVAHAALTVMCACLSGALKGGMNEKILLGKCWVMLVRDGIGIVAQDAETQLDAMCNLYGAERAKTELNRTGTFRGLGAPDCLGMVNEALDL